MKSQNQNSSNILESLLLGLQKAKSLGIQNQGSEMMSSSEIQKQLTDALVTK